MAEKHRLEMRTTQKIAAIVLALLLGATIYGLLRTAEAPKVPPSAGKNKTVAPSAPLIDQTPLTTAQQLAQLPTTTEELPLAKEALRLADYEVDLAYDAALRNARQHPPPLSPEAKQDKERLQKAQKLVVDDEAQMAQLTSLIAKTKDPEKKEKLQEQFDGVEADRDLASDEVDDAQEDYRRAGGDLENRIQEAQKQHQEAQHASPAIPERAATSPEQFGLYHRYEEWRQLHTTQLQLWRAKQAADDTVAALTAKHNALEEKLEAEKEKSLELAHHSKKKSVGTAIAPSLTDQRTPEEIAAAADRTWQLASEQEALANYDKRIDTNKQLSGVYSSWIDTVAGRQRSIVHTGLIGILIILLIAVIGIYAMTVTDKLLGRVSMDRRQMQNLRAVVHVGVRVAALLLILLVIIGPPGQLGTFLGLAGAGLTVALKDFIVAFIGWLVLMGKNGIRLGDWVEINGVSGEVVELNMFHTVLLETGNWTDTGHPTGRRVTFTNSFAIEGHYFNFSTSGQWLWDELQVVIPTGLDPYPVIDAIQKIVAEATAVSAKQAEQEWQRAARTRDMSSLTAAPAINVKPIIGGVEISVRYITRANERYQLRAKLYQAAVDLLGGKNVSLPTPSVAAAPSSD
jgi:small-conductance mechanosensitive channel